MSENSYILTRSFDPETFVLGATDLLSKKEKDIIEKNTLRLRDIAAHCKVKDEVVPDKNICNRIFKRFEENLMAKNRDDLFSSRELRYLIYAMYRIKKVDEMKVLVHLLDVRWKDRFFNGLLYYILANFESVKEEIMTEVVGLMQKKLKSYKGTRDKYQILKKNLKYFQINGPELLGMTLKKQDAGPKNYCSLNSVSQTIFGMSNERLDFEYFSRVIVAYFEKSSVINVDLIQRIMQMHNYDATPKRLVPMLVLNDGNGKSEAYRDNVRTLAIKLIGDPAMHSKWTFAKGSREEKQHLEMAREEINKWITRKIIAIFFEKCVEDPKRQSFWIKHADLVQDFKLYCTDKTYAALKQDKRISEILDAKTERVMETSSPLDPALGMLIGDYNIIEFTSNRALQIYKSSEMKHINYLSEFSINTLHNTIQSFCVNYDEGKLPHNSGWENTLLKWFQNHGII